MYVIPRPTVRRLFWPDAAVITVIIVITAVLVLAGHPPLDALALTAGAGLVGAVVVRSDEAGPLTCLLRRALPLAPSFV